MRWQVAGLLGLVVVLSPALATAQQSRPRPSVWMMPPASGDGQCFRELFTRPEAWQETRKCVDVVGYADHMLNRQFSDDELRAWLPMLERWKLGLGLEVGAIKPWGKTGQATFDAQRPMWDRFRRLGGRISAMALDEPLCCARDTLKKPQSYAVEETARFIALVRAYDPSIRIGDVEPYPSIPLPELVAWVDALQAELAARHVRGLDFFRLDVDWVHFTVSDRGNWREVKRLEDACQARKLPFSLIYWAADYPHLKRLGLADDAWWGAGLLRQGADYVIVGGRPDEFVVESWVGAPSRSVPETAEGTFTRSVRDFCRRFVRER
jgi:hypothetical protein